MICIIGGAFLLGGLLFSRSVSTILQQVVAHADQVHDGNMEHAVIMQAVNTVRQWEESRI